MKKLKIGCGRPTGTAVGQSDRNEILPEKPERQKERTMTTLRVGGKAPDFEAPAFHNGQFGQIKLSDYLENWVVVCFYPADFTFV